MFNYFKWHARGVLQTHKSFWREHPVLLYALCLLIGTSSPLFFAHFFVSFFWSIYLFFLRLFPPIILVFGAIGYGYLHKLPAISKEDVTAIFSPSRLQPHQTPFNKELLYQGMLSTEMGRFPCSIHYRKDPAHHPTANQSYLINGALIQNDPGSFVFKPKEWIPLKNTFSMAELRYQTKEKFRNLLKKHIASKKAAAFLASLITGDVEDRLLRYEFGRVGLQHLLAISGFHFGILIAFCSNVLNLFLSRKQKIFTLLTTVTAYYIFVGSSPAVERSWLTAFLFLISQWIQRPASGLNLLGIALAFEIIKDPWVASNIGFQLSFLSCAGILLFHSFFERKFQMIFPKRQYSELQHFSRFAQHGYFFSNFFRQAISLTLSVNLALFPVLLFHFHQFPLLSLLYNLFIPFFVGIAMSLLILALIFHLLFPPLASFFYFCTNFLTKELLEIVTYPPLAIDYSIRAASIPFSFVLGYLFFLGSLYLYFYRKETSISVG